MSIAIFREPWPDGFPDVIVHGDLKRRNKHPNLTNAKTGDAESAIVLVRDLLNDSSIGQLSNLLKGRRPFVVPVTAIEIGGFNAIPDAMTQELCERLDLPTLPEAIVQSNKVVHTKANGWHRLVTQARFAGTVIGGSEYLLVDDHVGFGGTLANLRGHITAGNGRVIGMTTLTETGGGRTIAVRREMRFMLMSKYGTGLDHFWQTVFGHGIDCLTDLEAGYLSRVESFDAIRNRLAEAAELARSRGLSALEVKA